MAFWVLAQKFYSYARNAVIAVTASSATLGTGLLTYKVVQNDTVFVEQIKVPPAFEELGFSSDVFTKKIIDNVVYLNRRTPSAKDRAKIIENKIDLEKLDNNIAGFSVKDFVALIGEFFGKKISRISGEITLVKDGDKTIYKVKLRKSPEQIVLVDFEAELSPDDLALKTALKLIEKTDPHIAAALYQGAFRDKANSLRMIEVVLSDDNVQNHKYTYNLLSQIHVNELKYEAAFDDLKKSLDIDPLFPATYANLANLYASKKEFENGIDAADKAIKFGPEAPYGYFQKGRIYRDMNDYVKAEFFLRKTIEKDRAFFAAYSSLAGLFSDQNKLEEASKWLVKGILIRPEIPNLYFSYGRILTKQKRHEEALIQYQKTLDLDRENPEVLMAIIDCYESLKNASKKHIVLKKLQNQYEAGAYSNQPSLEQRVRNFLKK